MRPSTSGWFLMCWKAPSRMFSPTGSAGIVTAGAVVVVVVDVDVVVVDVVVDDGSVVVVVTPTAGSFDEAPDPPSALGAPRSGGAVDGAPESASGSVLETAVAGVAT